MSVPQLEVRMAMPQDWPAIARVFKDEGGNLPASAERTAAVAIDPAGNLAGLWTLQRVLHAGPLWIRADHRGTGLWRALNEKLWELFRAEPPGSGYYSFSDGERMDHVFTELGYSPLHYSVWKREVK